jgi:membrane-bound serine protease (ClpP class)
MATAGISAGNRRLLWVVLAMVSLGFLSVHAGASAQSPPTDAAPPRVLATTVRAAITPVVASHVAEGIERAQRQGYDAYLVLLDTPGGLDTSMRDIVRNILAAEVPVIVYISPQGARGASAGAIITFAAHVAAMAPATAIGAATPVAGDSGADLDAKIINDAAAYAESLADLRDRNRDFIVDTVREGRSASATEALELGAIDVVAANTADLLTAIDGRVVVLGPTERTATLRTAGAVVDEQTMGLFRTIQSVLADPNIAFLLLSIGTLGLIYELASPGVGVGGTLGVTFILLGLFGLAVLPVRMVGLLFLVLAAVLFVAEVFAPGVGIAAGGGALLLVLSGVFLIEDAPGVQLSLAAILPTALVVGVFVVVAGRVAAQARTAPSSTTGHGFYVGHRGRLRVRPGHAHVFVQGAWWTARSADPHVELVDGHEAEVTDVDGLVFVVTPLDPALPTPSSEPSQEANP